MLKFFQNKWALVLLFSLSFLGDTSAQTTAEVWKHHIDAWQTKSLDAIVSDYTENSVVVLNNQSFKGINAIRKVFSQLFTIFENGKNIIDTPVLFDRFVYITWHLSLKGEDEQFGTDTFVIENGKIIVQTIGSPLYYTHPVTH
jgi:ketosteroid isomerase-like protein